MAFTHLWAILAGAAAIGLPLAVHWLTRPRPLRAGLSTLRFVQEAVHQRQARHRLRDALILLSRIVAILLLAFAFSRPLAGEAANKTETAASVERVVILDASASMKAVSHGVAAIERARGVTARYIDQQNGLKANLILAAAHPHSIFEKPSANLGALRDELGRAQARPERLNLQAALLAAGEMLEQTTNAGAKQEVIIVSDLQRTNWGAVDFSVLPRAAAIHVESVAPAETPDNVAITDVALRGRAAAGGVGHMEIEVANFSAAARHVHAEVSLDGHPYNVEGVCLPGAKTRMPLDVPFATRGWQLGEARLTDVNDALADDNVRAFAIQVHAAPTYLLVSRDGSEPRATSSNFVERALAPAGPRGAEKIIRSSGGSVDRQALSEADAVVLDRPGRLDPESIALLATSLRRGKSILYVASDPTDAINLSTLATQSGSDLRMPVEFLPPTGKGGVRRNLALGEVRRDDAAFSIFGNSLQPLLDSLRFTACLNSRPLPGGMTDDILGSYSDRSAFLVATDCGQGTLIIINADLSESNIVSTGAFVPLLGELTSRLLSTRRTGAVDCGEPAALPLPADSGNAADLTVLPPAESGHGPDPAAQGRIVEEHGALVWRIDAISSPGIYRVMRGTAIVGALSAVTPAEETDLSALTPDVLKGRLSGGRNITVTSASAGAQREGGDRAWVWLAVGAVAAIFSEIVLLRVFRT